ncbi:hypothetical protein SAMN05660657_05472 [Geodermatophilus amargosae]|uniref:Uncharacterized protein n=1 Tax=Geodermatophilus amargosae TaxID=1296565 RepID=A0A1I7D8L7_9ACTN|nr:hypothetical protein [Geodermatophilus amargosae]SFU08029.1 hypothetical protein SAMN05660657_05472 [Geodermatophilus amargosae]
MQWAGDGLSVPGGGDPLQRRCQRRLLCRTPWQTLAAAGGTPAPTTPAPTTPWTDVAVWAACHGMASLLLDSPLRALPEDDRHAAVSWLLEVLLAGLGVAAVG